MTDRPSRPASAVVLTSALLAFHTFAVAEQVTLAPVRDNTLYETADGSLSNGAGERFFAGRIDVTGGGFIRRGLLAFDIAGSIPAGSTVTGVKLTLSMSLTAPGSGPEPVSLHRLRAPWGEGTSDALGPEGAGAASAPGDATWLHRFFSDQFWSVPGGDFDAAASATIDVAAVGLYTWGSTPAMVADVQEWLDDPSMSFGWIVIGNEDAFQTAKRFDSRENLIVESRPMLTVEFTPPVTVSGSVPDGHSVPGIPLRARLLADGNLELAWSASCLASDDDYEVYEGRIGDFLGSAPLLCSTGGALSAVVSPSADDTFYVIVPRNKTLEGSYGTDHLGLQRPPSSQACLPQAVLVCQ